MERTMDNGRGERRQKKSKMMQRLIKASEIHVDP